MHGHLNVKLDNRSITRFLSDRAQCTQGRSCLSRYHFLCLSSECSELNPNTLKSVKNRVLLAAVTV